MAAFIALLCGMGYMVMLSDSGPKKAEEAAKPEIICATEEAAHRRHRRRRRRVYVDYNA